MTIQFITRDQLSKSKPHAQFAPGLNLRDHLREIGQQPNGHRIYEFVGTDDFGAVWQQRQRFEVDAGRDEEPLLYLPIYDVVSDTNLPKNVSINKIGPGGVIFEEVFEGGEVKFTSVGSSEYTVPIRHWATGLEYSKDLVIFNELWNVPIVERQMGIAHNALLNHLHFGPILTYNYTANNQTAANTSGTTDEEDLALTLQDAIVASRTDSTNPRRGPYVLLVSSADLFFFERVLTRVPQQGFTKQPPSMLQAIRSVIAYDGWSGTRGNKTVTYQGVTSGKAYLINLQYRGQDFRSFEKQALANSGMQEDVSRFMTQQVWDSYYGVYANPERAVQEITLPN